MNDATTPNAVDTSSSSEVVDNLSEDADDGFVGGLSSASVSSAGKNLCCSSSVELFIARSESLSVS